MKPVERVLLRLPNWIGDAAMATAVVRAFQAQLPRIRLEVVGRGATASLFPGLLPADRCLALTDAHRRAARGRFDLGVLLPDSFSAAWWNVRAGIPSLGRRGQFRDFLLRIPRPARVRRPTLHVVEEWDELLSPLGVVPSRFTPRIVLEPDELERGSAALSAALEPGALGGGAARAVVVLCPGAAYGGAKRWPVECWCALARELGREGVGVVAAGASGEEAWVLPVSEAAGTRPLLGLPVRNWAAALAAATAVVANDSGAAHVAAAVGTPVLALFGSSTPAWTRPLGEGHRWLYLALSCSPCFRRECPLGHLNCLRHLTPSMVLGVALDMLKGEGMP